MRWKKKDKSIPKHGQLRTLSKFLWLPVTIEGETRWLEKANIVYKCVYYNIFEYGVLDTVKHFKWEPFAFDDYG